jgi:hypothetical protein
MGKTREYPSFITGIFTGKLPEFYQGKSDKLWKCIDWSRLKEGRVNDMVHSTLCVKNKSRFFGPVCEVFTN